MSQTHYWVTQENMRYGGDFGNLSLNFFFLNWQYAPVCKLYRGVPLFWYSITLNQVSMKYSISRKSSYARSNLKRKKKLHRTRVSGNRVPCKKKFISVIAPYSGSLIVAFLSPIVAFFCKFFISVIAPYSRSPIMAFLSPIVTF